MTIARRHDIPLTRIASAFSEKAAEIFGIQGRGFLKPGYYADLIAIDPGKEFKVENPAYKCGWSPYEGCRFQGSVEKVWINGSLAVNDGKPVNDYFSSRKEILFRSRSTDSTLT